MLLELTNHRPYGNNATKMSTSITSNYHNEQYYNKSTEGLTDSHYNGNLLHNDSASRSVVQCYSVSTGKVSTLLRSPSQSSISSIEVAEINNLSEFTNTSKKGHQIRAIDSSSPSFVKFDPIGEKPVLFSAISEVKVEEVSKSSRKCATINKTDHPQIR